MVKKSLLWIYRTAISLIGIIVTIIAIAVFLIQFFLFPNINQYKNQIAAFASSAAKQKVVIGNIKADWQGVNPHLSLANIDIYDTQNRPALQLKNTDVSFSWLSIPLLEPHLADFTIRSPELTIRRNTKGEIFVAGMDMQGQSKPDLPNWLLRQSKTEVLNAKVIWLDEMRAAPALSLEKINLQVSSPPWKSLLKNHHITLNAIPSIGTVSPIVIDANLYGNDISHFEKWHGTIEASLKNTNISAFKPWLDYPALTHPLNLLSGVGSSDISVQFANRKVESIESKVALSNVQLQLKANAEIMTLNKLSGELNWKNIASTQTFSVNHLTLNTSNGLNIKDASGAYSESLQGNESFNLNLKYIDLAFIKPYLVQLALPTDVSQKIAGLSPTGKLEDLILSWNGTKFVTKEYQLDAKFNSLEVLAYEKIPGFSNFSGEIKANQNSGRIILNTQNSIMNFKDVLRWPIPVDKLDGNILWDTNGKETKIQVSQLNIINNHLSGTVNAEYLMGGNKDGYLDLSGKFGKGNAKYASFYYPIMLGTPTLHWLDTSIISGRAEDINLIVKGRLADFPFVDANNKINSKLGLFRVTAKISDSLLEFGTGWPMIEGLGLDLIFEGKRMELNANKGHIFGNQIIRSKTTIEKLDADSPILNVTSEIKGPVTEGIKFVNKSPVSNVTMGFTDDLKTNGQGKLDLSLVIPLKNVDAAQYKGSYLITNGSMDNDSIPALTNINGTLEFTENSLNTKFINANAFGSPVTFKINSGKDKIIRVSAKGKLNDEAIKQAMLDQDPINRTWVKGVNYISGNTDWISEIIIQKPVVNISVRTDLFGITSRLPAPFNKLANERLNLRIDKKQDSTNDLITINLGNKLAAKILRTMDSGNFQLDRGSIRFNPITNTTNPNELNGSVDLGNTKGLQVYGNLDHLDADAWRSVLRDFSNSKNQDATLPIQKIALKINTLDIFDRRINQLKISNNSDKDVFHANVQSREITGDLQWSSQGDNGKLIARLSNLIVPDATPNRIKPITKESAIKVFSKQEQDYPALDIMSDNFEFNKKSFGALELSAYPQNDNWNIQKLKLSTPDSTINAEGQWNNWNRNPNTYLNVTWDIKNLGKTLKSVGYPDTIKGGDGTLSGQLHWPGSPHEFNPIALDGSLQLDLNKGQILKVQPGVGRLLGLLSLQSLPRRLTLDFRDLFSNGFAFDKIDATVKIEHGVMHSDNFVMSGPAADVNIKGETNLQKETQHLTVKVLPHVSDSLSLAALAGGPVVGAVAFIAQKILKEPFNKIASSEYEIIGTWDNPQEVNAAKNTQDAIKNSPLN